MWRGVLSDPRNPAVFECILDYHRTGKLLRPSHVTPEQLEEELRYFNIPADANRSQVYIWGRGAWRPGMGVGVVAGG